MDETKRIARERRTIEAMIRLYCRGHHSDAPCAGCRDLMEYARLRLTKCPFEERKPTCATCSVHCYRSSMRQKVRAVMRYSGPRMAYRHPILTIYHLLDGRRKAPGQSAEDVD